MKHRVSLLAVIALAWATIGLGEVEAKADTSARLGQLGCYQCHQGVAKAPSWLGELPAIEDMGARYRSSYLNSYLKAPRAVRRHIDGARMPTFPMSEMERKSLVATLISRPLPPAEPALAKVLAPPSYGEQGAINRGRALFRDTYSCTACHSSEGLGSKIGPELDTVGARLAASWVQRFLVEPTRYAPSGRMPGAIFEKDSQGAFVARLKERDAKQDLADLTAYLFRDAQAIGERPSLAKEDAAKGAALVKAFGCEGCHGPKASRVNLAPGFSLIGRRLKLDYLKAYLVKPHAVRPFGVRPGDGGRMPNFRLSDTDAGEIAGWIKKSGKMARLPVKAPKLRQPSAYKAKKAERFVREKLDCLGCHSLGEDGGRIAPDLRGLGRRLEPDYLYSMLVDPQATVPGTVMPKPRFRPKASVRGLVFQWLVSDGAAAGEREYLSPLAHTLAPKRVGGSGEAQYGRYCAMCHGESGDGRGFNAQYMTPRPTAHTDGSLMSKRPDDTLFDGIHVGGFVLNKSHRMPGWGASLQAADIRALVGHIRQLCKCEQPGWAGDGR